MLYAAIGIQVGTEPKHPTRIWTRNTGSNQVPLKNVQWSGGWAQPWCSRRRRRNGPGRGQAANCSAGYFINEIHYVLDLPEDSEHCRCVFRIRLYPPHCLFQCGPSGLQRLHFHTKEARRILDLLLDLTVGREENSGACFVLFSSWDSGPYVIWNYLPLTTHELTLEASSLSHLCSGHMVGFWASGVCYLQRNDWAVAGSYTNGAEPLIF